MIYADISFFVLGKPEHVKVTHINRLLVGSSSPLPLSCCVRAFQPPPLFIAPPWKGFTNGSELQPLPTKANGKADPRFARTRIESCNGKVAWDPLDLLIGRCTRALTQPEREVTGRFPSHVRCFTVTSSWRRPGTLQLLLSVLLQNTCTHIIILGLLKLFFPFFPVFHGALRTGSAIKRAAPGLSEDFRAWSLVRGAEAAGEVQTGPLESRQLWIPRRTSARSCSQLLLLLLLLSASCWRHPFPCGEPVGQPWRPSQSSSRKNPTFCCFFC